MNSVSNNDFTNNRGWQKQSQSGLRAERQLPPRRLFVGKFGIRVRLPCEYWSAFKWFCCQIKALNVSLLEVEEKCCHVLLNFQHTLNANNFDSTNKFHRKYFGQKSSELFGKNSKNSQQSRYSFTSMFYDKNVIILPIRFIFSFPKNPCHKFQLNNYCSRIMKMSTKVNFAEKRW